MSPNTTSPASTENIISFFGQNKGQAAPPNSLYLPLIPRAKNYHLPNIRLPMWVLHEITRNLVRNTIPFAFNLDGYPGTIPEFNEVITHMREDREFVFHTPVRLEQRYEGDEDARVVDLRLETVFAKPLLDRITLLLAHLEQLGDSKIPEISYYNFLLDLVAQAGVNYSPFEESRDEFGNYWLILRNAAPYRERSFFQDVTILVQCIGNILRVIVGEIEHDIDVWYRYEWAAEFIRNLHRLSRKK